MKEFIKCPVVPSLVGSRHLTTSRSITVMTYNILAQTLMNRRTSFQYVDKQAAKWKNRRQLLLDEIVDYDADVICFQEMDFYDDFWRDELRDRCGYTSIHQPKMSSHKKALKLYGLTIAYKAQRFDMIDYKLVEYQNLVNHLPEQHHQVQQQQQQQNTNRHYKHKIQFFELCKSNVAQICALKMKQPPPNDRNHRSNNNNVDEYYHIIIVNTHAYWRSNYSYTRLRQFAYLMQQVNRFNRGRDWPVVIMGDFNMVPTSQLYALLTSKETRDSFTNCLQRHDNSSLSEKLSEFLLPSDILQNTSLQEIVKLHKKQQREQEECEKELAQSPPQLSSPLNNRNEESTLHEKLDCKELEMLERRESSKKTKNIDKHDLEWWLNQVDCSLNDDLDEIFDQEHRLNHVCDFLRQHFGKASSSEESLPLLYSAFSNYQQLLSLDEKETTAAVSDAENETNEPQFTTYNDTWHGTLDYMMLLRNSDDDDDGNDNNRSTVLQHQYPSHIVPYELNKIPIESQVKEHVGIPSEKFGSDHIPLVARFHLWPTGTRIS